MANPHAMNITSSPCTRNEKVLKTKAVSDETAARASFVDRCKIKTAASEVGTNLNIYANPLGSDIK